MGVVVLTRGKPLAQLQLSNATLMREIGLLARERIIRRTVAGQSSTGSAFAPYSPGYAKRKSQELGSASPVNLQVSGDMLGSIVLTEVTDRSVTLDFSR